MKIARNKVAENPKEAAKWTQYTTAYTVEFSKRVMKITRENGDKSDTPRRMNDDGKLFQEEGEPNTIMK